MGSSAFSPFVRTLSCSAFDLWLCAFVHVHLVLGTAASAPGCATVVLNVPFVPGSRLGPEGTRIHRVAWDDDPHLPLTYVAVGFDQFWPAGTLRTFSAGASHMRAS